MLDAGIRRGTILTVAVLIICVLGIVAALRIPVQMIPDLEVRTISVVTGWPGATPQDVEKEILIEQERYLRTLPNLKRMVSRASTGSSGPLLSSSGGSQADSAAAASWAARRCSSSPGTLSCSSCSTASASSAASCACWNEACDCATRASALGRSW